MNVYFNEYNLLMGSGGVTYLPFVSGILQVTAQSEPNISENYNFMPFVFSMESPSTILKQYTKVPDVAAFSISMWNENLSLHVAREIKKKYPHCLIIFGGAQCPHESSQYFDRYDFIDIAVRAEGETAFKELLIRCLDTRSDFSGIGNISFRDQTTGKCVVNSEDSIFEKDLDNFPSPYLSGAYEYLFANRKKHNYQIIIETNRGCPFLCTFCYWGRGGYTRKFRFHSLNRVKAEIEWAGKHRIPYIFNADSNFGMHKRDMEIAKILVEVKKRYKYPEKFRTPWGKNTDERIFSVASYLHAHGLDKSMTLGRQSNNKEVLINVKRDNIKLEAFSALQQKFNDRNVPVYAELILGLPGETLQSWTSGIEETLQAGLNNQLFIYPAEVYPNTELHDQEYQNKFGIKTKEIELREIHCSPRDKDWIREYQVIVVETKTMTISDWKKMMVVSLITMQLHSMKLGFYLMWYLFNRYNVGYTDLITFIMEKSASDKYGIISEEVNEYFLYTENLLLGEGRGQLLSEFGEILWYAEEASFLRISEKLEEFYKGLMQMVTELLHDRKIVFDVNELSEVFDYQEARIPNRNGKGKLDTQFQWNIPEYFATMFSGKPMEIRKANMTLRLEERQYFGDRIKYAKETVLWGRNSGTMCLSIDPAGCNWTIPDVVAEEKNKDNVRRFDKLHRFQDFKTLTPAPKC